MASIIQGYEYDIFISYRQKDNKGERWVSEFVDALKTELESTFKEEISVYFDINPHDGLLETHDVDASLEDKLKCLVFIPIISRTYCDPKSFAWEHEFKSFIEQASKDQFGLKVKLPNGNVTTRILPIQINEIHPEDKSLLEKELGGVLRAIEFIYKEPGVSRPLLPKDSEEKNSNKTSYRNQINKVANAFDEVIHTLKGKQNTPVDKKSSPAQSYYDVDGIKSEDLSGTRIINPRSKKLMILLLSLLFCIVGAFAVFKIIQSSKSANDIANLEKSIAVLPFENMSNDPDQEYFSNGMMEEILNHLFKIGGLKIPSSTSSMRFKGSKLSVSEIAKELSVSYVLEGNVSRSGDNVRIIVRLINGKNEQLIWMEDYKRAMTAMNLLEIQSDVAQQVAENMKVAINPEVKRRIEVIPTENTEAYTLYLQADIVDLPFEQAKLKLERAIFLDSGFADAYALLAQRWVYRGGFMGDLSREQVLENAEPLLKKALQTDKNSILAHAILASLRLYFYWDFESVEKEFQVYNELAPSNPQALFVFSDYLEASGKFGEANTVTKKWFDQDKSSAGGWVYLTLGYFFYGEQGKALETNETARRLFPKDPFLIENTIRLFIYLDKYKEAIGQFEKGIPDSNVKNLLPRLLGNIAIAYFKIGEKNKSVTFLNELLTRSRKSPVGSPSLYSAAVYTAMGEYEMALQLLEKAYNDHEVEMFWLKVEPMFMPLHGDPRFENLLVKIGFK